jgi:hypothetical protein
MWGICDWKCPKGKRKEGCTVRSRGVPSAEERDESRDAGGGVRGA